MSGGDELNKPGQNEEAKKTKHKGKAYSIHGLFHTWKTNDSRPSIGRCRSDDSFFESNSFTLRRVSIPLCDSLKRWDTDFKKFGINDATVVSEVIHCTNALRACKSVSPRQEE